MDVWTTLNDQIKASGPRNPETGEGNRHALVFGLSTAMEAWIDVYGAKAVLAALAFALDGEGEEDPARDVALLAVAYPGEVNPR